MQTRLCTLFVLLICLALVSSTPSTAARELGAAASPAAVQQQAQQVRLVNYLGGAIGAVTVQGNYVYLGAGPRLFILDVSDPAQPAVVGPNRPLTGGSERCGRSRKLCVRHCRRRRPVHRRHLEPGSAC